MKLVLLNALLVPAVAWAQAGFYIAPSMSVSEVYNDNIFFTAEDRQDDFISRFTPSLQMGYRSAPLTLLGRYSFDAEVYAKHAELTEAQVRQHASVEFRYVPVRILTLSLLGAYFETQTPEDLNLETGIEQGRSPARNISVSPSVTYRMNPLTTGSASYIFDRSEQSDVIISSHTASLGLSRRFTRRDSVNVEYLFRYFRFEGDTVDGADTTMSHALTAGWTRQLTRFTSLTLGAGPRFSDDGDIGAEVLTALNHRLKRGQIFLQYRRSQNTVSGVGDAVDTDIVTAALSYQLWRYLRLVLTASYAHNTTSDTEGNDTETYRAGLQVTYRLSEHLTLLASYQFAMQHGMLNTTNGTEMDDDITRNMFVLQLTYSAPYRVY